MQFVALFDFAPGRSPEDLGPLRAAEAKAVWDLFTADVVRRAFYRADRPGALLELEATSATEALQHVSQLPAVKAGVIVIADLVALAPYTGYEALFADEGGGT
jgi:hypothetical protein